MLLLIEDDRRIADFFTRVLTEEGHRVEHVTDLKGAQARLELSELDLRIGDRLLPDGDGLALVLTALDRVEDRVEGLSGGDDDSLTKPFACEEPLT